MHRRACRLANFVRDETSKDRPGVVFSKRASKCNLDIVSVRMDHFATTGSISISFFLFFLFEEISSSTRDST